MEKKLDEQTCLNQVKDLVKEDQDLKKLQFEDRFLLHFVRGRKFNTTKAYSTLKQYIYLRRVKFNDFFRKIEASRCNSLEGRVFRVLKQRDPEGRLIAVVRADWWNPLTMTVDDVLEAALYWFESTWNIKEVEINGLVAIWDCHNFTFKHMKLFDLYNLRKMHEVFWSAFPLRLKAAHITNAPIYFKMVHALVYPFIPVKLRSRTYFHGSESLFKHIPKETLPVCLGGTIPDDNEDLWDKQVEEMAFENAKYCNHYAI